MTLDEILALAAKSDIHKRIAATERADAREAAEIEQIKANRPLGVDAYRDEPKTIFDPVPPARIQWVPPTPRGHGRTKRFAER